MNTKQQLYNKCKAIIDDRLKVIQNSILDIQNALKSETKSSVGDKHETGRAMLQLEREKTGKQLAEIQTQFRLLNKINPKAIKNTVALGSVVYTNQSNYFIAVSVGEIKIEEQCFFAVSPVTAIGKLLMSKTEGDKIQFKNQEIEIFQIV